MSDGLKIQGEVTLGAEQAESALDRLGDKAAKMSTRVQGAADQAGKAVDGIGAGAEKGAEKFTRAESRIREAIKRSTLDLEKLGKTASEKVEIDIRAKGLDAAKFAPFIAELKQAEAAQKALNAATNGGAASLGNVGMSAKATAAALRGLPAQFTDIAVSLQSGQKPLTVLLQQGGQLKDMFGGIGPAAKALGGYIAGLVNPYTVAAAAVAVLGVELAHAESQLRQLNSVQVLLAGTGRSGLFPTAELKEFIAELAKAPGVSREVATQIVSEFAKAHEIGGSLFRELSRLAADYARATGTDIPTAAKALAKAFSDPEKGAKQLEEALGTLTSAQILAIERLSRLGDVAGAQRVLLDALKGSVKGLADEALTPLQQATNEVGNAWERLGQRMEHSQGLRTANEILAKTVGSIAWLIDHADKVPTWALLMIPGGGLPAALARNAEPPFRGRGATGTFDAPAPSSTPAAAASDDEIKRALEAARAYRSQAGQIAELKEKRTAFNRALQESIALYGKDSEQSKRLRDAVAGINEQIAKQAGQGANEVAGIKAKREAIEQEIKQLQRDQERLLTGDTRQDKQTDSEKQAIKLRQELAVTTNAVARAAKQRAIAEAEALIPLERARNQEKQINDDLKESLTARGKNIDAINAEASRVRDAAIAQEAANATTGKSKTAIEQETLAKFKSAAADKVLAELDPERHAAMVQRIADQERFVAALQQAEFVQEKLRLGEQSRALKEDAQTLQLEVSLLGRSREEREKILAQRRVEVELAKELAAIDKLNLGGGDQADRRRDQLKDEARANSRVKAETAAQKVTLDEWQKTADSINDSLTDALLRGFESGKGFAENFRSTLKNMFGTLVLKPIIQAVMAPVSGQLAAFGQQGFGSLFGQPANFMGPPSPFAGSIPGLGSITGSQLGFLGSIAAGGSMLGTTIAQAFGLKGAQLTTASIGGALLGGIPGAILGSLVAPGGGPKTESGFGLNVPTRGDPAAARAIVESVQAQYKAIAGQLAKDLQVGVFTATDPKGDAQTQVAFEAALNGNKLSSRGDRLGGIENVGRSDAELQAALTDEANRVVLKALEETHLPDKIGAYLKQLGDVDKLSGGALTDAVAKLQKAMTERATLEAQLFGLTHTALEQAAEARRKEREAIDDTNRALYDHVAALTDLTAAQNSAKDSLLVAFQTQSDALKATIERNQGFAQQLRDLRDSFSADGLTPAQRRAQAAAKFNSTLAGAIGGNEQALGAIGGVSKEFIDAVKASARTPAEVAAAVAKVQAGLTTAAASADGRASTAQQQLDAMTQQLSALGLLNTSVLSVGEALGAYLKAQTAIDQENLRYTAQIATEQAASDAAAAAGAAAIAAAAITAPVLTAEQTLAAFMDKLRAAGAVGGGFPDPTNGFAVGGLASGVARVGERGEEIVDFDTPGRVYTNEQTRGMFASNAALEPLLRDIKGELRALRADGRAVDVESVAALKGIDARLKKFDRDGMPDVRVIATA